MYYESSYMIVVHSIGVDLVSVRCVSIARMVHDNTLHFTKASRASIHTYICQQQTLNIISFILRVYIEKLSLSLLPLAGLDGVISLHGLLHQLIVYF